MGLGALTRLLGVIFRAIVVTFPFGHEIFSILDKPSHELIARWWT